MELKQDPATTPQVYEELLIVPYGIETWERSNPSTFNILLIVPYGIETPCRIQEQPCCRLLIVPYGIETSPSGQYPYLPDSSFNRTLWN